MVESNYNSLSITIPRCNLHDITIIRDDNHNPSVFDENLEWLSPAIETNHNSFNLVPASYILTIYDYIQNNFNNITLFTYNDNNPPPLRPQLTYNQALIAIDEIQLFLNDHTKIICLYGSTGQSMNHYLFRLYDILYAVYFDSIHGIHKIDIVDNNFIHYISPLTFNNQDHIYSINSNNSYNLQDII